MDEDGDNFGSQERLVNQQPTRGPSNSHQLRTQNQRVRPSNQRSTQEPLLHQGNRRPRYTQEQIEEIRRQRAEQIAEKERELELKYGAESVLQLIQPVSLCMLVVVATIRSVAYYSVNDTQFVYTPYESNANASNGEKFGGAILNALIIIAIVILMTCFLLVLYKYRCYKAIHGWLLLSSLLLLFFFSYQFLSEVLLAYNKGIDWITMAITVWNFGVGGLLAIHWRGPLPVQQVYLVLVSALMALVLIKNLPDWTTWVVLAAIAIYDLFAVLSPCGPLKALVETAQERDEPLFPALIYSSTMAWIVTMADGDEAQDNGEASDELALQPIRQRPADTEAQQSPRHRVNQPQQQAEEEEEESSGVKLGLGDFIFYSVLVGKVATANEWTTISACYVAILIGLACTLLLLSIFRKALPALPISIFFGIIFYFLTSEVLDPLVNRLNERQIVL